jgi:hypothetical protein
MFLQKPLLNPSQGYQNRTAQFKKKHTHTNTSTHTNTTHTHTHQTNKQKNTHTQPPPRKQKINEVRLTKICDVLESVEDGLAQSDVAILGVCLVPFSVVIQQQRYPSHPN